MPYKINFMKKLLLLLLCCSFVQLSFGDDGGEQKVVSKVSAATVFLNGAQVTRTATVNIPKGRTRLKFTDITNKLNKGSLNVSADGDFTIVSVMHQLNYLDVKKMDAEIDALDKEAEVLNGKIDIANQMLLVYQEEETFLSNNRSLKGQQGLTAADIKAAADFYRERHTEIKLKKLALTNEIKTHQEAILKIANQFKAINAEQQKSTSEVIVEVNAKKAVKGTFKVNYLVSSAGWYPNYDIRVKNVNSPIALTYKANVFQLSGEDWSDVKLTLSSGNPYQRSVRPILQTWRLAYQYKSRPTAYLYGKRDKEAVPATGQGYYGTLRGYITDAETGEGLIGVNVVIQGTSYGTTTNVDGYYQLNVPANVNAKKIQVSYVGYTTQDVPINNSVENVALVEGAVLNEIVVSASRRKDKLSKFFKKKAKEKKARRPKRPSGPATQPVQVQQNKKSTSVEFAIVLPYTIPTNGQQYSVEIKEASVPADYEYYTVPKLEEAAYLTARVSNWESYNLLDGEVNLYFEGTFLGKSVLNLKNIQDTLEVSLGRDKDIVVERVNKKELNKRQFIGTQQIATRDWEIQVRNKKKESIKLVVQDQIPVSSNKEIKVELKTKSKGEHDLATGIITWKLDLKGKAKETVNFKYQVKYPKKTTLQLE